jgi:hypothetical protein
MTPVQVQIPTRFNRAWQLFSLSEPGPPQRQFELQFENRIACGSRRVRAPLHRNTPFHRP